MMRLIISTYLIFAIYAVTLGQDILSLDAAIQTGLDNNYNIRIARNNATIAANSNTKANAGFLPILSTNGAYTYNNNNSQLQFFSGDEQTRKGASSNAIRLGALLSWTAFDGFRMYAVEDRLELTEAKSKELVEKEIHDLVSLIEGAYYIIVRLEERKEILEQSINLNIALRTLAQNRLELGAGTKLQVLQTSTQISADSAALLDVLYQIEQGRISLNRLMNIDPASTYIVDVEWSPVVLPAKEELVNLAIENNYDIQLLDFDEQIALTQIKELRSTLYPQLDLNLGYNYNFSKAEAGFLLSQQAYGPNFSISFNYDLFQGRYMDKELASAQLQVDNINLTKEQQEAELRIQIEQLYQQYQSLLNMASLEQRNIAIGGENVDLANELFRLGRATDYEVREAILSNQLIQDRLSDIRYQQKVIAIDLKALAGIPLWEN